MKALNHPSKTTQNTLAEINTISVLAYKKETQRYLSPVIFLSQDINFGYYFDDEADKWFLFTVQHPQIFVSSFCFSLLLSKYFPAALWLDLSTLTAILSRPFKKYDGGFFRHIYCGTSGSKQALPPAHNHQAASPPGLAPRCQQLRTALLLISDTARTHVSDNSSGKKSLYRHTYMYTCMYITLTAQQLTCCLKVWPELKPWRRFSQLLQRKAMLKASRARSPLITSVCLHASWAAHRKTTEEQPTTNVNVSKFIQKERTHLASRGHRSKPSLRLMWVRLYAYREGASATQLLLFGKGNLIFFMKDIGVNCLTEISLEEQGLRWGGEGFLFLGPHPSAARADIDWASKVWRDQSYHIDQRWGSSGTERSHQSKRSCRRGHLFVTYLATKAPSCQNLWSFLTTNLSGST